MKVIIGVMALFLVFAVQSRADFDPMLMNHENAMGNQGAAAKLEAGQGDQRKEAALLSESEDASTLSDSTEGGLSRDPRESKPIELSFKPVSH